MSTIDVKAELDALLRQFLTVHQNRLNVGLAPLESEGTFAIALALRYLAEVLDRKQAESTK